MNLQQVAKDLLSALEAEKDYERLYGELRLAYSVAGGKLHCSQVDLIAIKRFCVAVGVSNANELLREATGLGRQHHHAVKESLSGDIIESCFSKAVTCVTALDVGGMGTGAYKKQAPRGVLSREGFIVCIALIAQKWRSLRRQAAIMASSPMSKSSYSGPAMTDPAGNGTNADDFDDEDDDALALAATVAGGGGVTMTLNGTLSSTVAGDLSSTVTLRNPGLGNTVSSLGANDFPARKRALIVMDSALRLFADSNLRPYLREVVRINLTEQHIFQREINYVNNAAVGRVLWFYSEGLETIFERYSKESTSTSSSPSESKLMTQKLFAAFCDEFTICPNHLALVEAVSAFEEVQVCELAQSRSKQGGGSGARRRSTIFSPRGVADGISIQGFFELIARLSQIMYCTSRPAEALVDRGGRREGDGDGQAPPEDRLESVVNESLVDNLATKVDAFIHRVIAASFITIFDQVLPVVVGQGQTGYSPQAPAPLIVLAEPSLVCTTTSQPNPQPNLFKQQSQSNFDHPRPSFGANFSDNRNLDVVDVTSSSPPQSPYSPSGKRSSVSSSVALVRLSGFDFGSLNNGVWIYDSCTEAIRHMPQQSLQQQYEMAQNERFGGGEKANSVGVAEEDAEGVIEAAYFHVNFKSVAAEIAWDRCIIALSGSSSGLHQDGEHGDNVEVRKVDAAHNDNKVNNKGVGHVPLYAQASFFHDVRLVAANTIDDLPFASVKTGLLTYRHQHSQAQLYEGTRDSISHVFREGCARMAFNPHKLYLFCFEFILARYHICNLGEMNRRSLFDEPFEAPMQSAYHNHDGASYPTTVADSASIQPALTVAMESTMMGAVESDSDILYTLFHRLCTRSPDDLTGKGYLTVAAFTELLVRIALSHAHVTSEEALNDAISRLLLPCATELEGALLEGGEFPTEGALSLNRRGHNHTAVSAAGSQKTTQHRIIAANSIIDTLVTHSTNTGTRMNETLFKQNKALSAQVNALKEERRAMRAQQADSIAGMHQIKTFIEMLIPTQNNEGSVTKGKQHTSPLSNKSMGEWGGTLMGGKGGGVEEVTTIKPNSMTTPLKLQAAFRKELLEKYEGILRRMCKSANILTLEEEQVEAAARKRANAIKRREAKSKAIKAREASAGHTSPIFDSDDENNNSNNGEDDDGNPTSASPIFSFSAAAGTDFQPSPTSPPGNIIALSTDSYQVNFQKLREEVENFMMDVNNKFNNFTYGGGGGGVSGALTRRESFMPQSFSRRQSMVPTLSNSGFDNNAPKVGNDGSCAGSPLRQLPGSSNDPRLANSNMGDSINGAFSPAFGTKVANTPPLPSNAIKHQQYLQNPYMAEKEKKLLRDAGATAEEEQLKQDKRVLQGQADALAAKLQETRALNTMDSMRLNNELEIREREIAAVTKKQRETVVSALELQDRMAHISKINSGLSSDLSASNKRVSELLAEVRLLRAKVEDGELLDGASMLRDKVSLEKSLSLAASRNSIKAGTRSSAALVAKTSVRAKTVASKLVSKKGGSGSKSTSLLHDSNSEMTSNRNRATTGDSIFSNTTTTAIAVAAPAGMVSSPRGSTHTVITDASPSAATKPPHQTLSQRLAESRIARDVAHSSGNLSRVPTAEASRHTALSSRHPSLSGDMGHDGHPSTFSVTGGVGGSASRIHSELQSTLLMSSKKDTANSECQTDVTVNGLNGTWDGNLLISKQVFESDAASGVGGSAQPIMHTSPKAEGDDDVSAIKSNGEFPQTQQGTDGDNHTQNVESTSHPTAKEPIGIATPQSSAMAILSALPSPTSPSPTSAGPSPRGIHPPLSLQRVPSASVQIVASLRTRSESTRRNRGADLSASSTSVLEKLTSSTLRSKAHVVNNAAEHIREDFDAMKRGILFDLGRFGQIFNFNVSNATVAENGDGSTTPHLDPAFHLLGALIQAMNETPAVDVSYGSSPPRTAPQLRRDTSHFLHSRPQSGQEASIGGEYDSTTFLTSTSSSGRVESMGRRQRGLSINRVVTASGRTSLSQAQAGGSSTSHSVPTNEPSVRLAFKSSRHNSDSHHEGTPSPRQGSPTGDLTFIDNTGVQHHQYTSNNGHPLDHRASNANTDDGAFEDRRHQVDDHDGTHQGTAITGNHEGAAPSPPRQPTTISQVNQQPPSTEATLHHHHLEAAVGERDDDVLTTTTNHTLRNPKMPTSLPLDRHTSVDMAYSQPIIGANLPRTSLTESDGGRNNSTAGRGGRESAIEYRTEGGRLDGEREDHGEGAPIMSTTSKETPAFKKKMKMIDNMVGRKDSVSGGGARFTGSAAAQLRAQNTEMVPTNPNGPSAASRTQSTNPIPPRPPTGNGLVGMDRTARYIASTRPYTGTPSRPNTAQSIHSAGESLVDGGLEGDIIISSGGGSGDAWTRPNTAAEERGKRHSSGVGFTHNGVPPRHVTSTARISRVVSDENIDQQLPSPLALQFGSGSGLTSEAPPPTAAEVAAKKTIIAEAMLQGVLHMSRELQHERASNRIQGGDDNLVNYTISVTDSTTGAAMVFSREEYARMLARAIILANEAEFEQRKSPSRNETRTQQQANSESLRRRSVREATRLMTYDDEEIVQQERQEAKRLRVLRQANEDTPITVRPPPVMRPSVDGVVATTATRGQSRGQALISSRLGSLQK